jgi:L-threonylcarbamoyladenylate synthase
MQILKLNPKNKAKILEIAVAALRQGKTVVYPTDTTYGLGALAFSASGMNKIYKIKLRAKSQPIHVLVPSIAYAKEIVYWNIAAERLAKKYLPGALSIALPIKSINHQLQKMTAGTGYLGFRLPKNGFAVQLAKKLNAPITATSANPSAAKAGGYDPYSARDVIKQFQNLANQPDIIIDAGNLPKRKPSTFVKIHGDIIEILRHGPVVIK